MCVPLDQPTGCDAPPLLSLMGAHGRYDEAAELLDGTLARRRSVLGSDHPDTITSLNNRALLHMVLGEDPQAETLLSEAVSLACKRLGGEHPSTLKYMGNLYEVRLRRRGGRALNLWQRALGSSKFRAMLGTTPAALAALANEVNEYNAGTQAPPPDHGS